MLCVVRFLAHTAYTCSHTRSLYLFVCHTQGVTKVPLQASVNRPPTSEHLKLRVKNMIASAVLRRGSNQPET